MERFKNEESGSASSGCPMRKCLVSSSITSISQGNGTKGLLLRHTIVDACFHLNQHCGELFKGELDVGSNVLQVSPNALDSCLPEMVKMRGTFSSEFHNVLR